MTAHPSTLRIAPNSIEAEQAVLGGLLVSPQSFERVAALISEQDFYRRDHQLIFRAIGEMDARGAIPDQVTMAEWFVEQKLDEMIGGADYILDLWKTTCSAANILTYARIVAEKAKLRRVIDGCTRVIELAFDPKGRSADDVVDGAIGGLMAMQRHHANVEWTLNQAVKMAYGEIVKAQDNGGKLPGYPTGLTKLDEHLGGLHRSDLTVIGARPSMGKTALLFGMAFEAAKSGIPVGIISGEQPAVQLGMRMLALASDVNSSRMRNASLEEGDWRRISEGLTACNGLPIKILDRSAPTLAEVMRTARRWRREGALSALYVDYLQRIEAPGEKGYERVAAVAKGLKTIARDMDIPVVALAQVKREVELRADKRPRMGDMCDSSEIEKEADQILTLYRDDYYEPNSPDKGTAEILIDKNRHGETAFCRVAWHARTMRFADLEPGWRRKEPEREVQPAETAPRRARPVPVKASGRDAAASTA